MFEIYHGNSLEVKEPKIIEFGFNKDFGNGFYCSDEAIEAKKRAFRKGKGAGVVSIYKYDFLQIRKFNFVIFSEMTEEWLDFIVECRNGRKHQFDIVEGPMVDDEIYSYVNQLINGEINRRAFWELVKFRQPIRHICFCSYRALALIKFERSFKCERNEFK
jgi:hypothetical protein